jgi:hypothetical protein
MLKNGLRRLTVSFLAALLLGIASVPASAQDWYRRQQQQQQQQQRQMEQQRQQQMREQQRQQQQQQMREQMREQQRQQMREQQRQQMREQQRQQMREQQRGRMRGQLSEVSPKGVAKLNRPLTAGEIRRGFTSKVTPDGRALIRINGRVLAVPAARVGISTNRSQSAGTRQASRWSASQRASISASVRKLAAANPKNKVRMGGGRRRPPGGGAGGGDDGNPPTQNQVKVQFGAVENQISHAFQHTDKARLDRQAVKEAIQTDLAKIGDSFPNGHYNGTVKVNGRQLLYSALKLQNGIINVGSIKPQRR